MKILAVDTSGPICSVAVGVDGQVEATIALDRGRTHSTQVLPAIDAILEMAGLKLMDLDMLAVTVGPGSFTGIRIGIATVQGIAVAAGLPVVPLSSLAVMAEAAHQMGMASMPLIDARHQRAFGGLYSGEGCLLAEDLVSLGEWADRILVMAPRPERILLSGDAADEAIRLDVLGDKLRTAGIELYQSGLKAPMAADAVRLAWRILDQDPNAAIDPARLEPSYLSLTSAEKQLGIEV